LGNEASNSQNLNEASHPQKKATHTGKLWTDSQNLHVLTQSEPPGLQRSPALKEPPLRGNQNTKNAGRCAGRVKKFGNYETYREPHQAKRG
jgi:hypothetical protein